MLFQNLFYNNRDRFQGYERVNERVRTKRGHSEGSRAPDHLSPNSTTCMTCSRFNSVHDISN